MSDAAQPTTADPRSLRGAVVGLGMMGRHHARLLQTSGLTTFVGAVDPEGDRHGAVGDQALVFPTVGALLDRAPDARPEIAIVAVPTEEHLAAVLELVGAGVHVLVEKPLAEDPPRARTLIEAVRAAGVDGAVGHVERCNPALRELRRRVLGGQLGQVFHVATERIGPFPSRIRDVGVVKDLATHDLDLVGWLGGGPVMTLAAQTQHRMGRAHEDLVNVVGRLEGGTTFTTMVDWLSPTKVRRTRVLGERGMLVADTLTADLTFYANGEVASEWDAARTLRGVSEGDMTRYAIARREPLLVELEGFCSLVRGEPDAPVVTLEEGLAAVDLADAVLRSAASGETVHLVPDDGGAPGGLRGRSRDGIGDPTDGVEAPR
ncbi:NAD-dependent dehydrogenase [Patulibacter medicamentivorans]|uniref:NAD-dependent dehydrogenase n=1 Tax=Patulibacter medicamentivorans TaxID=1097667 RepID=H0E9I1_9ACTN|nr:Gfo/Idh/MocA family oxidoreductase [Patulibacter medicamentivorans]EHN09673.1 NAD-dependent dehydrogenase [Patulibacter medicamentivorans]